MEIMRKIFTSSVFLGLLTIIYKNYSIIVAKDSAIHHQSDFIFLKTIPVTTQGMLARNL